jgi:hypothetical protein
VAGYQVIMDPVWRNILDMDRAYPFEKFFESHSRIFPFTVKMTDINIHTYMGCIYIFGSSPI